MQMSNRFHYFFIIFLNTCTSKWHGHPEERAQRLAMQALQHEKTGTSARIFFYVGNRQRVSPKHKTDRRNPGEADSMEEDNKASETPRMIETVIRPDTEADDRKRNPESRIGNEKNPLPTTVEILLRQWKRFIFLSRRSPPAGLPTDHEPRRTERYKTQF